MNTTIQPARPVQFLGYQCIPVWYEYASGRGKALQLIIEDTGEPMATASVNIDGANLGPDEIAIKNYSENAGILQALQNAGIIGPVLRDLPAGWTTAQVCKILEPGA